MWRPNALVAVLLAALASAASAQSRSEGWSEFKLRFTGNGGTQTSIADEVALWPGLIRELTGATVDLPPDGGPIDGPNTHVPPVSWRALRGGCGLLRADTGPGGERRAVPGGASVETLARSGSERAVWSHTQVHRPGATAEPVRGPARPAATAAKPAAPASRMGAAPAAADDWVREMDAMQQAIAQGDQRRAMQEGHAAVLSADSIGARSAQLAFSLNELALAHALGGTPDVSVTLLERLLTLMEAGLGSRHAALSPVLGSLATVERQLAQLARRDGAIDREEKHLCRALSYLRRRDGESHPGGTGLLRELAQAAEKQGHADIAAMHLECAVSLARRTGDSASLVSLLEDLGDLESSRGRAPEAEALMKEAVIRTGHLLGPDHVRVTRMLEHLGTILDTSGQPARARRAYEKALDRWTASLGDKHPLVALRRAHLAARLASSGEAVRARELASQAVATLSAASGVDPELVAQVNATRVAVERTAVR